MVKNGIHLVYFNENVVPISPRVEGKLSVLVQGPFYIDFKNVEKTIELCMQSSTDEIWLLTVDIILDYPGVDSFFINTTKYSCSYL